MSTQEPQESEGSLGPWRHEAVDGAEFAEKKFLEMQAREDEKHQKPKPPPPSSRYLGRRRKTTTEVRGEVHDVFSTSADGSSGPDTAMVATESPPPNPSMSMSATGARLADNMQTFVAKPIEALTFQIAPRSSISLDYRQVMESSRLPRRDDRSFHLKYRLKPEAVREKLISVEQERLKSSLYNPFTEVIKHWKENDLPEEDSLRCQHPFGTMMFAHRISHWLSRRKIDLIEPDMLWHRREGKIQGKYSVAIFDQSQFDEALKRYRYFTELSGLIDTFFNEMKRMLTLSQASPHSLAVSTDTMRLKVGDRLLQSDETLESFRATKLSTIANIFQSFGNTIADLDYRDFTNDLNRLAFAETAGESFSTWCKNLSVGNQDLYEYSEKRRREMIEKAALSLQLASVPAADEKPMTGDYRIDWSS
jgi:hypothetical protein